MEIKTKFIIFIVLVVLIVGGTGVYFAFRPEKPGELDGFAECIYNSGAKFYGTFWCPHCQDQKKDFGSSKKYLPYVECSNPDNTQTQICTDKKIEGYPTWIFADGTSLSGRLPLETLRDKTQCDLPK